MAQEKRTIIADRTNGKKMQEINTTPQETKVTEDSNKLQKKQRSNKGGSKEARNEARNRRETIIRLWQEHGPSAFSYTQLAQRFNVNPSIITRDIQAIVKEFPLPTLKEASVKVLQGVVSTIADLESSRTKAQIDGRHRDRLGANRALLEAYARFTELLEAYGFKEKIADKIDIETGSMPVQINIIRDQHTVIQKQQNLQVINESKEKEE